MYVEANTAPSSKETEYSFLKLWTHNELTKQRHGHDPGFAVIKRGSQSFSEMGFKCERPDGTVYFLFPPSVLVEEGDVIAWGASSGLTDEWVITMTNRTKAAVRTEVRRPKSSDQSVGDLLRATSLTQVGGYLENARQRLGEGTPTGWSDCVANCRNALQTAVTQMTGEGQLSPGLRKLKDVCQFGEREIEFVERLEKLLLTSKDLLSKTGAHPPLPGYHFAAFALEMTTVALRFMVADRK
ncbi:MAG TPA: hypothetical protein VNW97_18655 [Candidatus Saccharimonadales bacterium]|jgi:hypothetical protein|nr:hypothetical protein [Candidatus Saccharimonadales bacterium]